MADKILLEVVTPERKVLEESVDRVDVPGFDGELGILPGHTELVSRLKPAGLLSYYKGEVKGEIAISDGFVEVSPERVMVLADRAERPEDIDLTRALKVKEEAEKQLQKALADPEADVTAASIEVERAAIQVQLAEKKGR